MAAAWLDGCGYVVPEDVQAVFVESLRHRIFFTPVYGMRRAEIADALVAGILARVTARQRFCCWWLLPLHGAGKWAGRGWERRHNMRLEVNR